MTLDWLKPEVILGSTMYALIGVASRGQPLLGTVEPGELAQAQHAFLP